MSDGKGHQTKLGTVCRICGKNMTGRDLDEFEIIIFSKCNECINKEIDDAGRPGRQVKK